MAYNLAACVALPGSARLIVRIYTSGFADNDEAAIGYVLYPYDAELITDIGDSDIVICRNHAIPSKPAIRISTEQEEDHVIGDHGNGTVDLPYDMVRHCTDMFEAVMKPRVSTTYKIATQLPIHYNLVPSPLRKILLRIRDPECDLSRHLTIEIFRQMLRSAFGSLGFHLERRNPASLLITHDIESVKGLKRADSFKHVEDELGLHSTWFVPSDEYPIAKSCARDLAEGSTIGSHDTRHDGRLIHVRGHDELVERLGASRLKLETVFEKEVRCFRSPLLQFSETIIKGLAESGYEFDFSVPSWEPVHPVAMKGFGVEAVQRFQSHGVVEFPLSLFQDHQLFTVMGMNTHEAVKFWIEQAKLIRSFDGDIVLLVHPDYSFSRDLGEYRKLLESLMQIASVNVPTPFKQR